MKPRGKTTTLALDESSYTQARWNIPIPVRRGQFHAPTSSLERFNVELDTSSIDVYGARRTARPSEELAYIDLQTNPDLYDAGKLGAGRAGCCRGRYLKGIGRTPAAANWNDVADQKTATGHFTVSGAIREYVVTRYLEAKGKTHLVNGCQGVLLRPLAESLRDWGAYGYRDDIPVASCDAAMQAISVKGSVFARFSNLTWSANHLHLHKNSADLHDFFLTITAYLDPGTPVAASDVTPQRVATALSDAVERTIDNFREFWRLGIFWRTAFNNVTADGRYHDLSPVLFVGGPFLGILPERARESFSLGTQNPTEIFGLDLLKHLIGVRSFVGFLIGRLSSLPTMGVPLSNAELEFLRLVVRALKTRLLGDHLLFSAGKLERRLVTWLVEDAHMCGTDLRRGRELMSQAVRRAYQCPSWRDIEVPLHVLPLRTARPGSYARFAPPHIATFCDLPTERIDEAQFMNDLVMRLDGIADPDELFAGLEDAAAMISTHCAPADGSTTFGGDPHG